jgi:hypothetical protein
MEKLKFFIKIIPLTPAIVEASQAEVCQSQPSFNDSAQNIQARLTYVNN